MPRYAVDVKAFINIEVEADSEVEAREAANSYVEVSLSPEDNEIEAWNQVQEEEDVTVKIISTNGFSVDGDSDVEEV